MILNAPQDGFNVLEIDKIKLLTFEMASKGIYVCAKNLTTLIKLDLLLVF